MLREVPNLVRRQLNPASAALGLVVLCTAAMAPLAAAQSSLNSSTGIAPGLNAEVTPPQLVGVDIIEHLGDQLPLDLPFTDDDGRSTTMGEILARGKPVLLHMGYLRCPMLCNMVLNEAVRGLSGVDWTAGKEFEFVSVSINPVEEPALAAAKKQGYLAEYGRGAPANGWHFLTGPESSSKPLADAVGFKFNRMPDGEYAHAAALFLISPQGKIVRYLYGVKFEPETLRMSLVEAGEGTIGTPLDRFILWCHQYDPKAGTYSVFAMRMMQLGGLVTLVFLGAGIGWLFWKDASKKRLQPPVRCITP